MLRICKREEHGAALENSAEVLEGIRPNEGPRTQETGWSGQEGAEQLGAALSGPATPGRGTV